MSLSEKINSAKEFISEQLLKEHSRVNTDLINAYIGQDPIRVSALVDIITTDKEKLHQRGCYVLWIMRFDKTDLLRPHLEQLVDHLPIAAHDAYGRALTSILSEIHIPEELLGKVADYCFSAMENPNVAIAIRAHSMSVLGNICEREPDLIDEVESLIRSFYDTGTAGYQSRAKRVFKQLENIRKNTQA